MKTTKIVVALIVLVASFIAVDDISYATEVGKQKTPAAGYVPDEETAIAIAVAVWKPMYGKVTIEDKRPYKAVPIDGVWHVRGTLPKGWKGGVPEAEINKDDGRILSVWHGK